jgi:Flp pilus assembly protein TadG
MQDPSAKQDIKGRLMGWLARLAREQKGNTLAIVGAALVPLTAMIGSGVDMSRAYMAKQRLQAACDAASLAGRRAMTNDTLTTAVTDEATKYFNFNFPQSTYGTAGFTPAVTRPSSGVVRVAASTTIPTAVMKIFGFTTLPISVSCDASLNFVNTDIVLVLDTTGSMLNDINDNSTSNDPDRKITALRDAVMALYDALAPVQTQLAANGLRLRYGIVPYSSTVNVGALIRAVNPAYIADNVEYQTRVANYNNPTYIGTPGAPEPPVEEIYSGGTGITQARCDLYGQNQAFSGFTPTASTGGGPPPTATWARAFSNNEAAGTDWGWPGAADTTTGGSDNRMSCRRRYVETDTTYITDYTSSGWSYEPESVDVSQFKLGNPVAIATTNNGRVDVSALLDPLETAALGIGTTTTNVTWAGCIEERDTVNTINASSGYTIPSGAYDLNINLIPTDDATRWKPRFPQITYYRTAYNSMGSATTTSGQLVDSATPNAFQFNACPSPAQRLTTMTRGDMQSYVNGLVAIGYTYHDIGMIWGARLASNAGIFADSVDTYNGMPVSRHIIFMTDGDMNPTTSSYSAYGIEGMQKRVLGSAATSELEARHNQRFKMICNAAKGLNISIWVIAFGLALTPEESECASNANQASTVANRTALIAKFTEIGNNIGALRLTQ